MDCFGVLLLCIVDPLVFHTKFTDPAVILLKSHRHNIPMAIPRSLIKRLC